LMTFALIYLTDIGIVWLMWLYRRPLHLENRLFILPALELLICPPFAINIIRRLSLRVPVSEDFAHAARRLLGPEDWQVAQAEMLLRLDDWQTAQAEMLLQLDDEISLESPDDAWQKALQARRANLLDENEPCPQLKLW